MEVLEQIHLQKLAKGDPESFVYLHTAHQAKVFHFCLKFVRNREVAEELTSDVFVKLWEKRDRIRQDIPIGGFLCKIAKDLSISHLRKVAKNADRRRAFLEDYFRLSANPEEDEIYVTEGLKIAGKAIENLPPKCREVFRLRYFDGLSLGQIAEKLQISTNTVQNHLQKGTRIVKGYLQDRADPVFSIIICQLFNF